MESYFVKSSLPGLGGIQKGQMKNMIIAKLSLVNLIN